MKNIKNFFEQRLPHWDIVLFCIILFYFTLRLCFFAASIVPTIPPDETDRVQLSLIYSQHQRFILPESLQAPHLYFFMGMPYLYFWIMGKLLLLNIFSVPTLIFLRIIHIFMSIATVIISFKLFRLLTHDKLTSLLGIVVLTNIPMYSFLAAFVSYDNLTNLLSVSSLYLLFSFFKTRRGNYLLQATITSLLGSLIKYSFLPLLLIFSALYVIDFIKTYKKNTHASFLSRLKLRPKQIPAIIVIFVLICLNANLYLTNLIRYRNVIPDCEQVLSLDQCMEKPNFKAIKDLENYAKTIPKKFFLAPYDYFFYWRMAIVKTTLGIFGHKVMFRSSRELLSYNILLILFLILLIRNFRIKNTFVTYCALSVLAYLWVVFYHLNYKTHYLNSFFIEASLQGRYIFPIIYLIVFLFSYFLLNFVPKKIKIILFIIICYIFILGDLPYFLKHADKSWYIQNSEDVQIEIPRS
ncbi:MAG: hypothetical protein P9M07_01390 [Candidatus Aceula meridiana]|nr:hypothetical protein [Candidatus Aceula meridiana]